MQVKPKFVYGVKHQEKWCVLAQHNPALRAATGDTLGAI